MLKFISNINSAAYSVPPGGEWQARFTASMTTRGHSIETSDSKVKMASTGSFSLMRIRCVHGAPATSVVANKLQLPVKVCTWFLFKENCLKRFVYASTLNILHNYSSIRSECMNGPRQLSIRRE